MKHLSLILFLFCGLFSTLCAQDFRYESGAPLRIQKTDIQEPVVRTALELLDRDFGRVFGSSVVETKHRPDLLLSLSSQYFADRNLPTFEAFHIEVEKGKLEIIGSDAHGLAYGILEVSRMIGVSPWEWWADATPKKKTSFTVPSQFQTTQSPSVQYRGIFINDEDWGIMPWSGLTYEPENGRGVIGPKTNARIFELLLRLRANYFWPAMHECTQPFFLTPGNREMAEKYGIYIGGSHCEPMASSTAGEWRRRGSGDYDYVHNREAVQQFWESRVQEVKNQPIVYTLGMRGVHDGKMQGAKNLTEQRETLQQIILDQRQILARNLQREVTTIPQVFIPYKEVLDIYNSGLKVPEDVCLMWCDDNYGYLTHFPDSTERQRSGGHGLYYHVSYWGRPHDYLWLGTFNPHLLYNQMKMAYEHDIRRIWVLNVGDIKPAEYQTELFMDMAWDIDQVIQKGADRHLEEFLGREFGESKAGTLTDVLLESYRFAFDCKPEFLGHTRTEEKDPKYKIVSDMPWSESFIRERMKDYSALSDIVEQEGNDIAIDKQDEYFQLIQYPIQAANQMFRKMMIGQLARHGKADWKESDLAYDSIRSLTALYNKGLHNQGKWNGMMDYQPRKLPVFQPLEHRTDSTPMVKPDTILSIWISPEEGTELKNPRAFPLNIHEKADSICIEISMLPTHAVNNRSLRYEIRFDDQPGEVVSIRTQGRSEAWKQNVLHNRSLKIITVPTHGKKEHTITLTPLDEGIFLREIKVKKVNF